MHEGGGCHHLRCSRCRCTHNVAWQCVAHTLLCARPGQRVACGPKRCWTPTDTVTDFATTSIERQERPPQVGGVGTARMAWDITQVVSLSADLNALTTESRQRGGGGEEGGWGLTAVCARVGRRCVCVTKRIFLVSFFPLFSQSSRFQHVLPEILDT